MASGGDDSEDLTSGTHEPRECMACRGTGSVISNLGGSSSSVGCPWCGGTGMRNPEADAQASWPANVEPVEAPVDPRPDSPAAEQPAG